MMARRQILKSMIAVLVGFLAACKHGPEGQYDRREKPNRDGGGGDGGY